MTDAYSRVYNTDPSQSPDAYSRSIALKNSAIRSQGVTTLTLIEPQNGSTLLLNAATAITVTIAKGLSSSFVCSVVQMGAGQVGFVAGSGVTLNSYSNYKHIAGQYASATVQAVAQDSYIVAGTLVT
jgi:hypothetical protein